VYGTDIPLVWPRHQFDAILDAQIPVPRRKRSWAGLEWKLLKLYRAGGVRSWDGRKAFSRYRVSGQEIGRRAALFKLTVTK